MGLARTAVSQAFRAFARVYLLVVGALYGPYYVKLGQGSSGTGGHLGLALAFACAIQLAMSGLFNLMLGLEDAFARRGGRGQLDSVRVPELVEVTRRHLLRIENEATLDWRVSATATAGALTHTGPMGEVVHEPVQPTEARAEMDGTVKGAPARLGSGRRQLIDEV